MNDNIRISVILPTYNVDKYIDRCITSLKKQELNGLEFIFVDDCSNDNTLNIIEKYADNDDRFIIIKNNINSGQGKCRNIGIEIAKGEYLSFIDPDDYISDDFYTLLYKKTKQTDSDLTKGQRITIDISTNIHESNLNKRIVSGLKKHIPLYYLLKSEHQTILYKKNFIEKYNIRYGNSKASEDKTFLLRLCLNKPSVSFEENAKYYYCLHEQSITRDFSSQRFSYELDALEEIIEVISNSNDSYTSKYLQDVIKHIFNVYSNATGADDDSSLISRLKAIILKIPNHETLIKDFVELEILLNDNYFIPLKTNINDKQTINKWIDYLSDSKSKQHFNYFSYVLSFITLRNILKNKVIGHCQNIKQLSMLNKEDRLQIYTHIPLNVIKLLYKGVKHLFFIFI